MPEDIFEKAKTARSTEIVFKATFYWLNRYYKRSGSFLVRVWIKAIANVRDVMRKSAQKWFQRFRDRNLIEIGKNERFRHKISEKGRKVLEKEALLKSFF